LSKPIKPVSVTIFAESTTAIVVGVVVGLFIFWYDAVGDREPDELDDEEVKFIDEAFEDIVCMLRCDDGPVWFDEDRVRRDEDEVQDAVDEVTDAVLAIEFMPSLRPDFWDLNLVYIV
jgi:hypothetical protein